MLFFHLAVVLRNAANSCFIKELLQHTHYELHSFPFLLNFHPSNFT